MSSIPRKTKRSHTSRASQQQQQPTELRSPVDWERELLKSGGEPIKCLANAITALRKAPPLAELLAWDEFELQHTSTRETPWKSPAGPWGDRDDALLANWLQHHGIFVKPVVAAQASATVAHDRPVHPVRDYLSSLAWDGTERLNTWLHRYLGVEVSPYSAAVGQRWLISAVARVFQPGVKADCMLILEGTHGIRKSSALRALAGDSWFTDELAPLGTKDAAEQVHGVWIIELPELSALKNSEVEKIKAFVSRTTDRFRPSYGRHVITAPRQCVFAGSTNATEYLHDETGARRFWPVTCGKIDIESLARDRDQLWAEATKLYHAGSRWWLDSEDQDLIQAAALEADGRYERDPWHDKIAKFVHDQAATADVGTSVPDVLQLCLGLDPARWTQRDQTRVGRCLRKMGLKRIQVRTTADTGPGRMYVYKRPTDPASDPSSGSATD